MSPLEFIKPKTHVICLLQCGGLWFVNGKVSITWNLKQAIVQRPKDSMEGKCFLKPKQVDKERLKTLPPPEDFDQEGGVVTTNAYVEDSDNEEDTKVVETITHHVPIKVVEEKQVEVETSVTTSSEEPKKKRILKKKADA